MSNPIQQDLSIFSDNDPLYNWTVTLNSVALNLTGYTVNLYLKVDNAHSDTDATTVKYSIGQDITLGNQTTAPGTFTVQMSHTDLVGVRAGTTWTW